MATISEHKAFFEICRRMAGADASAKSVNKKVQVKFRGIVADARALRVNRVTLWRALTGKWGKWDYSDVLHRYEVLKGRGKNTNKN